MTDVVHDCNLCGNRKDRRHQRIRLPRPLRERLIEAHVAELAACVVAHGVDALRVARRDAELLRRIVPEIFLERTAVRLPLEDIRLREVVQELGSHGHVIVAVIAEDRLIRLINALQDFDIRRRMRHEAAWIRMMAAIAAARRRAERSCKSIEL